MPTPGIPRCEHCGDIVRVGDIGNYRMVSGWVQERKGGGAHSISEPKDLGRYMHEKCWKDRKLGGQGLFF